MSSPRVFRFEIAIRVHRPRRMQLVKAAPEGATAAEVMAVLDEPFPWLRTEPRSGPPHGGSRAGKRGSRPSTSAMNEPECDSQCALPAGPGVVSVSPFFAKMKASNLAGSVLLAFLETSCVLPGGS